MSLIPAYVESELMLLSRHLLDLQRRAHGEGGALDRSAFVILSRIDAEGPLSIKQLRERLGLDDSTLNRQTSAVFRAGWVVRVGNRKSGAARQFELTAEGKARLDQERLAHRAELHTVLSSWSEDQVDELYAVIHALNVTLEEADGEQWPRVDEVPAA